VPSQTFYTGSQLLPVEQSGTNSALRDPTLDGLLAFFGHWLKFGLDSKLSELQGPTSSAAIEDACPAAHRFPWNHNGTFMRAHNTGEAAPASVLPGLWIWEEGSERSKEGATLWHSDTTLRTLRLNWVFPQVQIPDGFAARSGLIAAAQRLLAKACFEKCHATHEPAGWAAGTTVTRALNLIGLELQRSSETRLAVLPSGGTAGNLGRPGNEGAVQRFYPCLDATIRVWERVGVWERAVPEDVLQDSTITIAVGDNTADTIDLLERAAIAPADT